LKLAALASGLPGDALNQLRDGDVESTGEFDERVQARELVATNQLPDLRAMDLGTSSERFLGEPRLFPVAGEVFTEALSD